MNLHAQEILKRNFQFLIFLGMSILCLLSLIATTAVLLKAKPQIIAIDTNGTRFVTDQNDPVYKSEKTSFIQKFIANIYNFNSENFMKKIGVATTMMSEELWGRKRNEILDLKSRVERDDISLSSSIEKLSLEDDAYFGLISIREKNRFHEKNHKIKVKMTLKVITRSKENPAGLEIDGYEEIN